MKISPGLLLLLVLAVFIGSCGSYRKTANKKLTKRLAAEFYLNQFTGVLILDAKTKDTLLAHNHQRYFTPASTVKIVTLYSGLQCIPERVPALAYEISGDTLYVQGTGDPTFLNPNLPDSTAYHFLKRYGTLAFTMNNYSGNAFMPGWAWEDYPYYFSPELGPFPFRRNVVTISKGDSLNITPAYFRKDVQTANGGPLRQLRQNTFTIPQNLNDTLQIPYITSDSLMIRLLGDELGVSVFKTDKKLKDKKVLMGMPADSVYKQMLWQSDNFTAEQLMLVASSTLSDTLSFTRARNFVLENHLNDLRQPPRWVDGSGLSRYNLFTPESLVQVLGKLYAEVDEHRLFALFPAWNDQGTILGPKAGKAYFIHAKSGSMGNVYNLCGFLRTKNNRLLLFGFMNNHFKKPTRRIRKEMYAILHDIHEHY